MVRTERLTKHFHDPKRGLIHAVEDVTLEAHPGQVFGLLGVNGAGKTTALRILSTVLRPTSGRAEVAGHDVQTAPEKVRASIGFMSASTALYGRLSPRETLRFFGGMYGMDGSSLERRIGEVLETFGIADYADSLCDKLSTGQKQRVSIARTILHDPPVLFFDEPTAGLDVVTSQTVLGFIEDARSKGKTIVFSSHIMSEAERLCDHIAIIHNGTIRGEGTVADLKTQTGQLTLEKAFLELVGELSVNAQSPDASPDPSSQTATPNA